MKGAIKILDKNLEFRACYSDKLGYESLNPASAYHHLKLHRLRYGTRFSWAGEFSQSMPISDDLFTK